MRNRFTPQQLTPSELARLSPPEVANPSDNLKNLFELPTVFYAVVLYLYVARQVDGPYLGAAWIFFGFRVLHSAVHCTFNFVPLRFWLYAISAVALWFMEGCGASIANCRASCTCSRGVGLGCMGHRVSLALRL